MNEADILALTYEDIMNVYRTSKQIDDKTKITSSKLSLINEDIPCALSKKDLPILSGDTNNIVATELVFCRPEVDVKEGDILEITRYKHTNKYICGLPFDYKSHKEIPVVKKERV